MDLLLLLVSWLISRCLIRGTLLNSDRSHRDHLGGSLEPWIIVSPSSNAGGSHATRVIQILFPRSSLSSLSFFHPPNYSLFWSNMNFTLQPEFLKTASKKKKR